MLETMRECLTDVFDLDGLLDVQRQIAARAIRLVEVETAEPSPFARSLLFGYVGAFVYEGDVPLAEKKAAALSLDASLLAELLGKDGLKQLLDAGVIAATEADLQGLSEERRASARRAAVRPDPDGGAVHPGRAGRPEPARTSTGAPRVQALVDDRRAGRGADRRPGDGRGRRGRAAAAGRSGHPGAARGGGLVQRAGRASRSTTSCCAGRGPTARSSPSPSPSGTGWAGRSSRRPAAAWSGRAPWSPGRSSTCPAPPASERTQYCHAQVLALIKRRTLGLLRAGGRAGGAGRVRPVPGRVAGRWTPRAAGRMPCCPPLEQLAGLRDAGQRGGVDDPARPGGGLLPGDAGRAHLAGEMYWVGDGPIGETDGWVRWYVADQEPHPGHVEPAHMARPGAARRPRRRRRLLLRRPAAVRGRR